GCSRASSPGTRAMGTEAPTSIVIPVRCAPKKAPCPDCGTRGRSKRTLTRTVRTVAYKAVAVPEVTYGEYAARCGCRTTSRDCPGGVPPKAKYDSRVRELVLDRLLKGGMSVERALESSAASPSWTSPRGSSTTCSAAAPPNST